MTDAQQPAGVDFHCHLDLYSDHQAAIARSEAASIYTLSVTTTPKAWPRNYELTRNTNFVRAALGLHPQLVAERGNELPLWERYLKETRYVGEVGLDAGPRFYKSIEAQKYIFRTILEKCAKAEGKILSIHSVRCVSTVLDMLEKHLPRSCGKAVLHWFTGSRSEARRATKLGCYFSINAEMTRSDRGRTLINELSIDRILTETDGPFTQVNGHPAEPVDAHVVIEALAHARNMSSENISKAVQENLRILLT
jgi:TatD DNase family protein